MNKVVVVAGASLKQQPLHHQRKKKSCANKNKEGWQHQQQLQDDRLSRDYESWVPLDYSVAQLKQDVVRYWCLPSSKHYQLYDQSDRPLAGEWQLDFLSAYDDDPTKTTFMLKRVLQNDDCLMSSSTTVTSSLKSSSVLAPTWTLYTAASSLSSQSAAIGNTTSSKLDPFWIQEKLFELFLFYALQNMTGKVLWVTCYQFKSLLQKATSKSTAVHRKKRTHPKLEFDTRVLLAFKGAVPNSSGGAGATFDEFLDALVDVAGFLFPKLSPKELAFEKLVTKSVIPQYEKEQYTGGGGKSSLSWSQMDALLAKHSVNSLIQRFIKPIGDLAACYSTTIGGTRSFRGLQFHEFSKFVHDIKPKWFSMNGNELCDVFIRCCRVELSQQYSETATLASLYFSNSSASKSSSFSNSMSSTLKGSVDELSKSSFTTTRSGNAGGNFTTHGGGNNSVIGSGGSGGGYGRGSNPMTESGGALEILCAKMMSVFGYLALITVPPLAKMSDPQQQLKKADFSTMSLTASSSTNTLALLSVKAFLHHIANHLSGKSAHHAKKNAAFALARVHFLHEFHKMHQEDTMNDYLSALTKEIQAMVSSQEQATKHENVNNNNNSNAPQIENTDADSSLGRNGETLQADKGFDLSLDWGDEDDDENDDNSDGGCSVDSKPLASIDPLYLNALRQRELEDLTGVLNEGDEIYSFLASELQRHVLLDKRIDDTDTVSQMLDMWVAAGQKYAQVISHVETNCSLSVSREAGVTKAGFLQRFGCSLYVFARQLLTNTTKVHAYEEFFAITNARVYGVKSAFWDDSSSVFTMDLAMETLSLASGKLTTACTEYIQQLSDDGSEDGVSPIHLANSGDSDEVREDDTAPGMVYEKYLECLFHRANCLAGYGDILAHNTLCVKDYELGCLLEEELEVFQKPGGSSGSQSRNGSLLFEEYHSVSALSKISPPGHFYREANRIYRFIASHAQTSVAASTTVDRARCPLFKVHHELSMTQFKLATHLPRGCVAEKKLLEEALVNLAICQKLQKISEAELELLAKKKEYISAILVLRHKFFQPEGPPNAASAAKQTGFVSGKHRHSSDDELIAPFYRFVLAAAFKDFDGDITGVLTQKDLSKLNKACGRSHVSDTAMHWLLLNFDHQGKALTEKGLLQYFCWIAEADPLAFCEILDIFTSKYTETHHASITTSRPSHISKEPKAKSLRSILFAERRQQTTSSSSSAGKDHRPSIPGKNGIVECVVVLSGKMTPETCGNLSKTKSPSDIRLEPEVIDVLPSTASLPDELSKFCFPDDVFLYDEPLPPKTFDIVLTDIKGDRLYGSCLHFYEEKDPMDVLALISGVQKGRTASLPSWISLRDIQQHKTRWKCFVPKCLCVLSSYPLFQTFRDSLTQLYRLSLSGPCSLIESFVFNLAEEIPLPSSNLGQTSIRLMDRACLLTGIAPGLPAFYPAEVDFTILFQCLSPENILKVYAFLLAEKKLVVCSSNHSILTPVTETLRALLHPFECQVVYIPVLPLVRYNIPFSFFDLEHSALTGLPLRVGQSLLDFVSAPVPFFMGVRSDKRVESLISEGVVVVDLDKNEVLLPPSELMPSLPDVKAKKLLQALRKVSYWASNQKTKDQFGRFKDGELSAIKLSDQWDQLESDVAQLTKRHDELIEKWSELQSLFSNFATRLLKDFRKYCSKVPPSPTGSAETIAFDKRGFLTMRPSLREFCTHLFQTQLFQRFIERSALDGGTAGAEQEVSWLSVRSKSVIWKSEPAEETTKAPIRQIVRAPSPFNRDRKFTQSDHHTSCTQQRRASLSGTDAFPTFNTHAYEELLSRSSKSAGGTSSTRNPSQSMSTSPVSTPPTESSKSSLSFHIGDSPASKLVSEARQRLETANTIG